MFNYHGNLIFSHDDIKAAIMDAYRSQQRVHTELEEFTLRDTSCPSRPDDFFNKGSGYSRFVSACWRLDFTVNGLDYVYYIYCRNKTDKNDDSITVPSSLLVGKELGKKLKEICNPHYDDCFDWNYTFEWSGSDIDNILNELIIFADKEVLQPILKDLGVV